MLKFCALFCFEAYLMRFLCTSFLALIICLCHIKITYSAPISLRDKIGQMLIIGFEEAKINPNTDIKNTIFQDNIGGVILFDKNIESPEQVKILNIKLQMLAKNSNQTLGRPNLPLLISTDYEGGKVSRLRESYGFPATDSAESIGQKTQLDAKKASLKMARTLKNTGFNLDFAPVADVNTNPDNPIIAKYERSFSDNPETVAHYAGIYSESFLSQGVQCAYKHFPGHGSANGDSHKGFVDVTETWSPTELTPYQDLLSQPTHCGMIMTAHIVNHELDSTGLPATLSHQMLTGVLRQQLGFDGVIVTDDMQMKAISSHYSLEDALTLTINAGTDMMIFGNQLTDTPETPNALIDIIEAKVNSGEIKKSRIDDAYRHIVSLKQSLQHAS
jgi:beta-N-acetylhexosaminidase